MVEHGKYIYIYSFDAVEYILFLHGFFCCNNVSPLFVTQEEHTCLSPCDVSLTLEQEP